MPTSAPRHRPNRPLKPEHRPNAGERGYGWAWQRYRLMFLSRPENVICASCKHYVASVVDHIVPHKGDSELFWEETNHQALCKRCHDRKTAIEDGGFGRKPR